MGGLIGCRLLAAALVGPGCLTVACDQTIQCPAILAGCHNSSPYVIPLCLPMDHSSASLFHRGCLSLKMGLPLQQLFDGDSLAGLFPIAFFLLLLLIRQSCAGLLGLEQMLRDLGQLHFELFLHLRAIVL
jgi:hypothetical protein